MTDPITRRYCPQCSQPNDGEAVRCSKCSFAFLALTRGKPQREPSPIDRLMASVRNKPIDKPLTRDERANRSNELALMRAKLCAPLPRQWATELKQREESGEILTAAQSQSWRIALGEPVSYPDIS